MATKIRLLAVRRAGDGGDFGHAEWPADCAGSRPRGVAIDGRPVPLATTTIKWPVVETVDPSPFDACRDIPLDVIQRIGLDYTPPEPEDGLRCHYDAGNYQMAVESFVWRTYEESLPPDAVELDVDGHRAAQYWVMKPTDWNNRWWITCMMAFKTDWGVIQQSLYYSPIYAADDVDCMQTNLQRAHELAPYYRYTKRDASE
jgi:hypothetical protein